MEPWNHGAVNACNSCKGCCPRPFWYWGGGGGRRVWLLLHSTLEVFVTLKQHLLGLTVFSDSCSTRPLQRVYLGLVVAPPKTEVAEVYA